MLSQKIDREVAARLQEQQYQIAALDQVVADQAQIITSLQDVTASIAAEQASRVNTVTRRITPTPLPARR